MAASLVRTLTRDGIQLDGAVYRPESDSGAAYCLVHGTGGNFYSSMLFDFLAERLLEKGCTVLRVNTRGHDSMSIAVTSKGGARLGAAYEFVDECRHDLLAWAGWLRNNGAQRVGLIGHSLGAVKCLYAAAHEPELRPDRLVAISPPRLSYSWFCSGSHAGAFLEDFEAAEGLRVGGQPLALLEVKLPLPMVIAAAAYVEKYGPDERYKFLKFLGSVACPTLVLFGEVEVERNLAFQMAPAEVAELAKRYAHIETDVIAKGDHFYAGVRAELWERMERWFSAN